VLDKNNQYFTAIVQGNVEYVFKKITSILTVDVITILTYGIMSKNPDMISFLFAAFSHLLDNNSQYFIIINIGDDSFIEWCDYILSIAKISDEALESIFREFLNCFSEDNTTHKYQKFMYFYNNCLERNIGLGHWNQHLVGSI
jgi:hypothetical protein